MRPGLAMLDTHRPGALAMVAAVLLASCGVGQAASPSPAPTAVESPTASGPGTSDPPAPDGIIVFLQGHWFEGKADLVTIWPDGSHAHRINPEPLGDFSVSADGRHVAMEGKDLVLANLDGTGAVTISFSDPGRPTTNLDWETVVWAPDGQRIAFHGGHFEAGTDDGLYTARASDGGDVRRVATSSPGLGLIPISYSPDGTRILFARQLRQLAPIPDVADLFVVNVDGTNLHQLNPTDVEVGIEHGPPAGWSPDGRHIAFSAFPASMDVAAAPGASFPPNHYPPGVLYVVAPDGSGLRKVVGGPERFDQEVRWSPNGSWIFVDGNDFGSGHAVAADGSREIVLDYPDSCCGTWSPDSSSRLLIWDMRIVDLAGSPAVPIPGDPGHGWPNAWVAPGSAAP